MTELTQKQIQLIQTHARNIGMDGVPSHVTSKWGEVLKASLNHDAAFIRAVLTYIRLDETDFDSLTKQALEQREKAEMRGKYEKSEPNGHLKTRSSGEKKEKKVKEKKSQDTTTSLIDL
eukprot:GHVL01013012.1.p1 GENE.GHVL01013012.1~~GHVL01013012.1.p1  ORF type:complete len:119 (-),score=26.92 GHVL01013012.1:53-409(-)